MLIDELLNPKATTWEGRPMQDDDENDAVMTETVLLRGILLRVIASPDSWPTKEAEAIFERHLAEWARLFLMKNLNYRAVRHLGSQGVFPDINRKVGVLEDRVWNGNHETLIGESTQGVIYDLIGHLFMMAAFLAEEDKDNDDEVEIQ